MGSKQVGLLLTVVMLVLAFDCGNCNTQEIGKVGSIRSNAVIDVEDSESVLRRDSRSVHRSRRSVLNSGEMQEAIGTHNGVRRLEGASDMELMTWSNDLAIMADDWAQHCINDHPPDLQEKKVGQNIYLTSSTSFINITAAIMAWYNEKPYFNYDTLVCDPTAPSQCGHYTQVVWAISREVGCAYWNCTEVSHSDKIKSGLLLVCNYRSPGNVDGQKPFKIGTGCSRCASGSWWCNEGLCDQSCTTTGPTCGCAPVCLNFASVNTTTCSCSCAPGWWGSDCSLECKNYDSRCDPPIGVPGLLPDSCNQNDDTGTYAREHCPKMCKKCQAAGDNNHSTSTKPSLLNMLSVLLSWLLLYSFRSV